MPLTLKYSSYVETPVYIPQSVLAELTDDSLSTNTAVQATVEQYLYDAESIVNAYLSKQYDIPVLAVDNTVPGMIKQWVYTIARYNLIRRRNALSDEMLKDLAEVMAQLQAVADGDLEIPIVDGSGNTENGTETILFGEMDQTDSVFTDERMAGFL